MYNIHNIRNIFFKDIVSFKKDHGHIKERKFKGQNRDKIISKIEISIE